ncbi:MAG: ribonuclease P protein component [Chloroflexi bacterium]|nr:ribonuclease P protein component [Chloroflexota bacterium]
MLRSADFERVRKEGARWRGRFCILNAARAFSIPSVGGEGRIGYITAKRVGGAVQRNRARRLMREAIRALAAADELPPGWDLVLIAQNAIVADDAGMAQVKDEIRWLLKKVNQANPAEPAKPATNR